MNKRTTKHTAQAILNLAAKDTDLDGDIDSIDVNVQDQITPPLDFFFIQQIGTPTTLAVSSTIYDRVINVTSTADMLAGRRIGIFSGISGENRFYFGDIINVSGNNITLDSPLDFAFEAGDPIVIFTKNLNVNGSVTPQIYKVSGPGTASPVEIDITRIMFQMECSSAIDLNKFGDLTALVNGIVLRRINGVTNNIWNLKSNFDISLLAFDYKPFDASNPIQGINGISARSTFSGQSKHGVAVRLKSGESLDIINQDNLEGLVKFNIMAQGHVVTD